MNNKALLLCIHIASLFSSCVTPSYEENFNVIAQVHLIIPDSLLYFPDHSISEALETEFGKELDLFLISELYIMKGSNKKLVERRNEKYNNYSETLNSYTLKSNADYLLLYFLEFKKRHESFYELEDLANVRLRGTNNTIDIAANKESFVGMMELRGRSKDGCDTVILKSPFSFYKLRATDLRAFIEKHGNHISDSIDISIEYLSYYPYVFDISAMRPIEVRNGCRILNRVPVFSNSTDTLDLAYDFIFMGEERAIASICITIIQPETSKVYARSYVKFDYFLKGRKVIEGDFLTSSVGGIIIDTTFNDDILIDF